jgi:putative ABC transport system substrate-binding protein
LIVLPDPATNSHRKLIVQLAARYHLPAIHALRAAAADGGLMSYGVDIPDLHRQAAAYVDRILRGDKPADLLIFRSFRALQVMTLSGQSAVILL